MTHDILDQHAAALARVRELEALIERANRARYQELTAPSAAQRRAGKTEADRAIDEMKAEAEL